MRTSAEGLAFLQAHEGVALKAYRDPVGVWTIGAGLTAASGVVKPHAGMILSAREASELLDAALKRNYEPAVASAMTYLKGSTVVTPSQTAFDAGVSFHFNTGAIGKATWVKRWRAKAQAAAIRAGLVAWNKGGGRVLPGLTRRRKEEADLLLDGVYTGIPVAKPRMGNARWGIAVDAEEIARIREGFRQLGYDPGPDADGVITASVIRFQADHDLKADNIIGRATLSTLQRALDARAKAKPAAAATVASGGAVALPDKAVADVPVLTLPYVTEAVLGLAALYALWLAWRYRDQLAARVQVHLPRVAAFLRSF